MEKLYYLSHKQFHDGDLKAAFKFAMELCKKDSNIDTITLLVPQVSNYDIITRELKIATKECKSHIIPNSSKIRLQVHTVKTYHPTYQFAGCKNCELLIAIIVNPKDLEKFIDCSRVKYWIIVPWMLSENKSFFEVHEAIDIETGDSVSMNYKLDDRVRNAIEWLKVTSYPNSCFHHPNDITRLKQMSNALSHYKVPLSYDAIVNYCINDGIIYDAAKMIAEHFTKAQRYRFPVRNNEYLFMKSMMEKTN